MRHTAGKIDALGEERGWPTFLAFRGGHRALFLFRDRVHSHYLSFIGHDDSFTNWKSRTRRNGGGDEKRAIKPREEWGIRGRLEARRKLNSALPPLTPPSSPSTPPPQVMIGIPHHRFLCPIRAWNSHPDALYMKNAFESANPSRPLLRRCVLFNILEVGRRKIGQIYTQPAYIPL
jgi:hypothetical protein